MLSWLVKNEKKILWSAIILYFLIFSLISILKYFQFGYNGLDLAIYNQVFFNSAAGRLFQFSIHPQSYLGDHLELFILFLLPLYTIFKHPVSLLIIQSAILALSAWPLYLIAKRLLPSPWPLFIALAWLFNPFVQNINLFEFHLLPFAIPLLLFAFYFYQENKFPAFLLFAFCSLLVREDVALVIFMFGILALFDRRTLKWVIWPLILASAWFILAIKIIAHFAPEGTYKFLYYYAWLGENAKDIFINALIRPQLILAHLFTWQNLFFTLALLLPFAYLVKTRFLLLGLLIYLQLILGGSNNSTIALKLHYTALLLPILFIAFNYALKSWLKPTGKIKGLKKILTRERPLTLIIIFTAVIYSSLMLGPLPAVVKHLFKPVYAQELRELKNQFLKMAPAGSSLAATYEFLTNLSGRLKIYSLHYAFIGKRQFSSADYRLPADTETLLIDFDDLLTYSFQFPNSLAWQKYYQNGDDNLRKLIKENDFRVSRVADSLVLMERHNDSGIKLYETAAEFNNIEYPQNINLDNQIKFLGWSSLINPFDSAQGRHQSLPLAMYFQPLKKLEQSFQLKLILKDADGQSIYQKFYPLAYGLYPSSEWQIGETVKINYWFLIPEEFTKTNYQTEIQLVELKGFLTLNGLRSVVPQITKETSLGEPIILK